MPRFAWCGEAADTPLPSPSLPPSSLPSLHPYLLLHPFIISLLPPFSSPPALPQANASAQMQPNLARFLSSSTASAPGAVPTPTPSLEPARSIPPFRSLAADSAHHVALQLRGQRSPATARGEGGSSSRRCSGPRRRGVGARARARVRVRARNRCRTARQGEVRRQGSRACSGVGCRQGRWRVRKRRTTGRGGRAATDSLGSGFGGWCMREAKVCWNAGSGAEVEA
eukprot:1580992-Rhodomonas_salina.8